MGTISISLSPELEKELNDTWKLHPECQNRSEYVVKAIELMNSKTRKENGKG
jgi:metal-responsive CopG/Arc/MetJ family transcriptional regulator